MSRTRVQKETTAGFGICVCVSVGSRAFVFSFRFLELFEFLRRLVALSRPSNFFLSAIEQVVQFFFL